MKKEIFDQIKTEIVDITFNLNDQFYYASADCTTIEMEDLNDLSSVIELYGYCALLAYESIKRGHEPQVKENITEEFKAAKNMILDLMGDDNKYKPFYYLKWS